MTRRNVRKLTGRNPVSNTASCEGYSHKTHVPTQYPNSFEIVSVLYPNPSMGVETGVIADRFVLSFLSS